MESGEYFGGGEGGLEEDGGAFGVQEGQGLVIKVGGEAGGVRVLAIVSMIH